MFFLHQTIEKKSVGRRYIYQLSEGWVRSFLRRVSLSPLPHPWRGPWEAQSLIENEILGVCQLAFDQMVWDGLLLVVLARFAHSDIPCYPTSCNHTATGRLGVESRDRWGGCELVNFVNVLGY
jgi:hypothetical protein